MVECHVAIAHSCTLAMAAELLSEFVSAGGGLVVGIVAIRLIG
jgi:hypothetical protein